MTVSSSAAEAIFLGNGSLNLFTFNFVGVAPAYIQVSYTDASNNTVILSPSLYTLTLNPSLPGQIWGVGGSVRYPLSGPAIASGTKLTVARVLTLLQLYSIGNQGPFDPGSIEAAIDYAMMCLQQLVIPILPPPSTTTINVKQLKMQLAALGLLIVVNSKITADITQTANIQWRTGGGVTVGDPLALAVQSALGYSNAQMLALFIAAALQPA